jgi:hypothetical protein
LGAVPKLTIRYARIAAKWDSLLVPPGQNPVLLAMATAFEERRIVNRYGHDWRLGNFQVEEPPGVAVGRLGYPDVEHEEPLQFDPVRQVFEAGTVEYPASVSAGFALDPVTGTLAFEDTSDIGPTGFVSHLVALLNVTPYGPFEGALLAHPETYRSFVRRVDKVTRVTFEVVPTNPRDKPIFRDLDRGIKAAGASKERVTLENDDDGLIIDPPETDVESTDNPAVQGLEMVEAGYGTEFGYRIDAETPSGPKRYEYTPADRGTVAEVDEVEEAPADPESRLRIIVRFLRRRSQAE